MEIYQTINDLYYGKPYFARSPKWPAAEKRWLLEHPTCEGCGGTTHLQVHHKIPVHIDPSRELDPDNFKTMCVNPVWQCHLIIGHKGNWQKYRLNVDRAAAEILAAIKCS